MNAAPSSPPRPRIGLIHALAQSQPPVLAAFAALWPEAETFNLLDDSLAPDLAATGSLDQAMMDRFLALATYAAQAGPRESATRGILFTCSAFGPAIERVQRVLGLPVLKPNEAAFEQALESGKKIGLVATFPSALTPMLAEFRAMAQASGRDATIEAKVADGALAALCEGALEKHDALIADAAQALGPMDVLVLGQFSMARAAGLVSARTGTRVLTTPEAAVAKMRRLVGSGR
ncbi:MAG: hypothetical protein JWM88_2249 [Verrucomicrobia bacterium]|nr:hypothetical protein [Verrucomicrobiota bacterium]